MDRWVHEALRLCGYVLGAAIALYVAVDLIVAIWKPLLLILTVGAVITVAVASYRARR